MGVSENWGVPYFGVLIIGILPFRVPELQPDLTLIRMRAGSTPSARGRHQAVLAPTGAWVQQELEV